MREIARIHRILSLLEKIWEQQQDVRFNQLVANLQHMYSIQNEGYGKKNVKELDFMGQEIESSYLDFFNLEDEEWEKFLQLHVKEENID